MNDQRLGAAFRAVRVRRGWRQSDVASRAGASRSLVSLIERGHIGSVSVETLGRVGAALDVRVDVIPRWRGGELDRLLNARHSALGNALSRWLGKLMWGVAPEVSFAIAGERGWIDLLAWHAPTRSLLVIEIKTEIVDVQELIGVVDRKVRLATRIARDRGWVPASVSVVVVVAEGPTNRRRVAAHADLLRSAFPMDGRTLRQWLKQPVGSFSGLAFFSDANGGGARSRFSATKRVRVPKSSVA